MAKPLKELRLASKTNTPEAAYDQVKLDSKEDRVRSRSPLNISGRIRESSSKYGGEGSGDGITEVQESREEENEEGESKFYFETYLYFLRRIRIGVLSEDRDS